MITNLMKILPIVESNCKSNDWYQYVSVIFNFRVLSFEKMISDKYQGVIVCLILKDLINKGELFGGQSSPRFDNFETFNTQRLSTMEGWYVLSNYSIFKIQN